MEPTHKFFWQEVARRVGSRSAGECFDKVFAAARSPPPARVSKAKLTVRVEGRVGGHRARPMLRSIGWPTLEIFVGVQGVSVCCFMCGV